MSAAVVIGALRVKDSDQLAEIYRQIRNFAILRYVLQYPKILCGQ